MPTRHDRRCHADIDRDEKCSCDDYHEHEADNDNAVADLDRLFTERDDLRQLVSEQDERHRALVAAAVKLVTLCDAGRVMRADVDALRELLS